MSDNTRQTEAAATVNVKIQQAYDLHVNLKFHPVRDIPGVIRLGCQPRQGGQRIDKNPVDLPEPTRQLLLNASKAMSAWLARDGGNQRAFVADPIAALRSAGIEIDRVHLKAIDRIRENIGQSFAVTPGLQLRSVKTNASKNGRVPAVDTESSHWTPPATPPTEDCSCDHNPGRK